MNYRIFAKILVGPILFSVAMQVWAQVSNCPFVVAEPTRGAVSDALLLNRYARGVAGDSTFVSGTGLASTAASSHRTKLQELTARLDLDGDGQLTAFDAQVAARIRMGYTVEAAVVGLTPATTGSRETLAKVQSFLQTGCPAANESSVIGPIEIISWAPTTAYPGIAYSYRLGVIGGRAPYTYTLVTGPSGMTVAAATGEVSWTAPTAAASPIPMRFRVTDALGAFVEQPVSVQVTSSGFYFVATTGDDTAGTGTITSPWRTLASALNKGATGNTLYVRGGNYVGGFDFVNGKITRLMAYPGDTRPVIDLDFSTVNVPSSRTWVEGLELFNFSLRGFSVDGEQDELVFRRNLMHHLYDTSQSENPSFIFFWDSGYYDRIIIQDNVFHDLFDRGSGMNGDTTANYHGGASVMYNVRSSLIENNEVRAIDGSCFKDKDNGQRNTFRGNYFHDCADAAIHLSSQYTQDRIEISWNVLKGDIVVGSQPGYIRDVDVRHNTIFGSVTFGCVVGEPQSVNFIVKDNILIPNSFAYQSINCRDENGNINLASQNKTLSGEGKFDYNLIDSSYEYVFGFDYYATNMDWATWRAAPRNKDAHSRKAPAQLTNMASGDFRPQAGSSACAGASDGRAIGARPCAQ